MQKNTLTAELQLYRLLMKHLEDSTRPQPYPKAVVDFAEFVRREAENDLDHAVFFGRGEAHFISDGGNFL